MFGSDGSEIESCTVITTKPTSLVKQVHNRMPVIIPKGLESKWLGQNDSKGLSDLEPLLSSWDSEGWLREPIIKGFSPNRQMSLF